jgi:hypothetical protein
MPRPDSGASDLDAEVELDAGEDPENPWAALGDAGNQGGPLELSLAVNGQQRECGDCAVLTARVSGGTTPYEFVWNAPGLKGPGPHQVCDAESRAYSVTVSDSAEASSEFGAQEKTASVDLQCKPPSVDKGPGLSGCKLMFDASILSSLNPSGPYLERMYGCTELDGGPGLSASELMALGPDAGTMFAAQGFTVPEGLRAGQSYQFVFELLFPLQIGGDLTMELWGSREGCGLDEKVGEFKVVGVSRQTTCLTLEHDYERLLAKPADNLVAPLFSLSFGVSMTLCSDCSSEGP